MKIHQNRFPSGVVFACNPVWSDGLKSSFRIWFLPRLVHKVDNLANHPGFCTTLFHSFIIQMWCTYNDWILFPSVSSCTLVFWLVEEVGPVGLFQIDVFRYFFLLDSIWIINDEFYEFHYWKNVFETRINVNKFCYFLTVI